MSRAAVLLRMQAAFKGWQRRSSPNIRVRYFTALQSLIYCRKLFGCGVP
jgi:hypothetical protein